MAPSYVAVPEADRVQHRPDLVVEEGQRVLASWDHEPLFLVGVLGRSCRCTGVGEITRLHVVTGVLPNHPRAERFEFFHALRLRQLPKAIFQRRARGEQDFSLQFVQGLRVRPDLCLKLLDADPIAQRNSLFELLAEQRPQHRH